METVAFEAEKRAVETIHFKYEWRSTLCRLGVVSCDRPPTPSAQPAVGQRRIRPAPAGKVIGFPRLKTCHLAKRNVRKEIQPGIKRDTSPFIRN